MLLSPLDVDKRRFVSFSVISLSSLVIFFSSIFVVTTLIKRVMTKIDNTTMTE